VTLRLKLAEPPPGTESAGLKLNTVDEVGGVTVTVWELPPTVAVSAKDEYKAGSLTLMVTELMVSVPEVELLSVKLPAATV